MHIPEELPLYATGGADVRREMPSRCMKPVAALCERRLPPPSHAY